MSSKIIISHSEVTNFNECERKHAYTHILNLQPVNISEPLQYGIIGHEMLEAFYTVIKNGGDFLEAFQAAFAVLKKYKNDDTIDSKVESVLDIHMQKYFYKYMHVLKEWEILEVEKKFIIPLPDKPYDYGCKIDIIALFKAGEHKDKIGIVDHKFLHNYYTESDMLQHVQIPRYSWAAQQSGYKIDFGMLAQIRYRTFKDYSTADLFSHKPIELIPARVENAMSEFYKTADIAYERHLLAKKVALDKARRSLSRLVCKYCDFNKPCNEGLNGRSEKNYLIADYVPNDYGYTQ